MIAATAPILSDRCAQEGCQRLLRPVDKALACRCTKLFCATHRLPEAHNCDYDYKAAHQKWLRESMPRLTDNQHRFSNKI